MHDHHVYAVLNDHKPYFPLEKKLRTLSAIPNTMVIAVFDCGRESIYIP